MTNICIIYWDMGCEFRKQNSLVSWNQLKRMLKYLREKGLKMNAYIFEFGKEFVFNESIKMDYDLDYFEKSKKINLIMNHPVNSTCDYLAIMDSDTFFLEDQFDLIYNHIVEIEEKNEREFFTYNLLDIDKSEREQVIDFENHLPKFEIIKDLETKFSWRHSWGSGVLGGFFIAPISKLKQIGGFNENFLTWGAEDDEAQMRLKGLCHWNPKMNQGPYHLWHPKNEKDDKYFIPVYSDEYFQINKVEKPVTFVSFCVDIDRGSLPHSNTIKRDFSLYLSGMMENVRTNVPLVLYSSIKDLEIPNNRNVNNFRHHYYDKILVENEFPNFDLYKQNYPTSHKDEIATALFYYTPLVVSKMKKMIEVVNDNPFNSEYFFWMDCFFIRGILKDDFLYKEDSYLKMCENVKNKLGDKFVLLNFGPRPFGFFWGGSKFALEKVYEKYFDIFFEFLPEKLLTEELIFKIINERFPDLMHVIEVQNPSSYKITCQEFLIK
jgi:hypothetical protein